MIDNLYLEDDIIDLCLVQKLKNEYEKIFHKKPRCLVIPQHMFTQMQQQGIKLTPILDLSIWWSFSQNMYVN
jgi:hypothetical protein